VKEEKILKEKVEAVVEKTAEKEWIMEKKNVTEASEV
jgi:hypothetical protein